MAKPSFFIFPKPSWPTVAAPVADLHKRLAQEAALLETLESQRADRDEYGFGKIIEDRIIWRELLDLELQEIDEQIERLSQVHDSDNS